MSIFSIYFRIITCKKNRRAENFPFRPTRISHLCFYGFLFVCLIKINITISVTLIKSRNKNTEPLAKNKNESKSFLWKDCQAQVDRKRRGDRAANGQRKNKQTLIHSSGSSSLVLMLVRKLERETAHRPVIPCYTTRYLKFWKFLSRSASLSAFILFVVFYIFQINAT